MPFRLRDRVRYIALALATIVIGLAVHLHGGALPPAARDVLGDALWAMTVTWVISAIVPKVALPWRAIAAATVCLVVEFSQLVDQPALNALRRTSVGHLVLGNSFDPRDLAAYFSGVIAAVVFDWMRTAVKR